MHGTEDASPWIQRWTHLVPAGGEVLDVASGRGRHARWFAQRGHPVVAVDRDAEALAALQGVADTLEADIENGPWPFPERQFAGVVVTNYLWRALLPQIVAAVAPGGVLLYETLLDTTVRSRRPARARQGSPDERRGPLDDCLRDGKPRA